jgi:hypothetical protein
VSRDAKNIKTIGAYTESTDLIFKAFPKIIHFATHCPFKLKNITVSGPDAEDMRLWDSM